MRAVYITASSEMWQTELFSCYRLRWMCEQSFPHTAAKDLKCVNLRGGINFLLLPQTQETATITIHMDVISSVYQIVATYSDSNMLLIFNKTLVSCWYEPLGDLRTQSTLWSFGMCRSVCSQSWLSLQYFSGSSPGIFSTITKAVL